MLAQRARALTAGAGRAGGPERASGSGRGFNGRAGRAGWALKRDACSTQRARTLAGGTGWAGGPARAGGALRAGLQRAGGSGSGQGRNGRAGSGSGRRGMKLRRLLNSTRARALAGGAGRAGEPAVQSTRLVRARAFP